MNRSSSELCFRKFLEGAGAESARVPDGTDANCNRSSSNGMCDDMSGIDAPQPLDQAASADADPGEYAVLLKKKLDIYCAAVAKSRGSEESSSLAESGTTSASQLVSQSSFTDGVANGRSAPFFMQNSNSGVMNSCSSKELSEGDLEANTDPTNEKKTRRMLSNRESARRSRKRKQVHLNDLESQVSQLRVENASLSKRLSEMTQNYNDASVGNRVLKADIETLRAKVKMAEDLVKRVTERCDTSAISMSFSLGPISDMSVSEKEDDINVTRFFHQTIQNNNTSDEYHGIEILVSDMNNRKIGRSASVHRVASLEHLQNRMSTDQWDAAT